ncbi:MAG: hypothetical protein H6557_24455 [Lewinellaceae bacterium]|nr:hypothetical protein [Phaeodactylibacter sp.]MCB9039783.1 hypothetical protein [Lewinellaceae bacterium]
MVTRITTLLAMCCALATTLFSQSFDPDFQPFVTRPGDVEEVAVLPDGRFVAAGSFAWANRVERRNIARFLPDGSLDENFKPDINFSITALAVQPDGKALVGGSFLDENAPDGITVLRLNADGSRDDSFRAGFAPEGSFAEIAVENSGSILVGGSFNSFGGQPAQGVVRLGADGSLLGSIALNANGAVFVSSLLVQDNGRFAVGGAYHEQAYLSYHEPSGAPVAGFNFSIDLPGTSNTLVSIRQLSQDSQGRFVFSAGTFLIRYAVGLLNADGSFVDWSYVFGIPQSITVDSNDDIFVAGDYYGVSAVHAFSLAAGLDNYDGGIGADGLIRKVALLPGGGFLAVGHFSAFNGQPHLGIVRLDGAGLPAAGFSSALERVGLVRSLQRSGPDKVYISGEFAMVGDTYSPNIARVLLATGEADPDFRNPGISYRNEIPRITLDAQGRILAAGTNVDNAESPHEAPLLRLLPSGAFDPAFHPDAYPIGRLAKVLPLANGQLLVIGDFNVFNQGIAATNVALYNPNGSLVRSFSSRIQAADITEVIALENGSILLGGRDIRYDGAAPQHIIRLDASLNRDFGFEAPSEIICTGGCRFKFTEQEDGKILVGGVFRTDPSQAVPFRMARLEANGALDSSFQLAGSFDNSEPYVDGGVRRMISLPGGRILAVGLFDSLSLQPAPCMILLEENGNTADDMQSLNFERQFVFDACMLDNGDFLVGGILSDPSRPRQAGLARVTGMPQPNARIAGWIRTYTGMPVEGVEISIAGQPGGNMLTDANGNYDFPLPQPGSDYTVMPMLNTGHTNGVSTFDLLLISRHILGNTRFDSPYQIIAADANNSHSLTTLDLIAIQQLILGRVTEFPNNYSWRFIDAAYAFPDPMNPWQENFSEMIGLSNLPAGGIQNANFIAIKIGDVDGSAITVAPAVAGRQPCRLHAADQELKPGDVVQVPVTAGDLAAIRAMQFTLRFDPSALQLENVGYGLFNEAGLGLGFLDKGWITAGSYQLPEQADPETPLFTLAFRARQAGRLSDWLSLGSDFTRAEAYSADGQVFQPELAFGPAPEKPARLLGNAPNPFSAETAIAFEMEQPGEVVLLVHSVGGRLLRQLTGWYEAGRQQIRLSGEGLPEGVLFYNLQMEGGTATGKMVVRR